MNDDLSYPIGPFASRNPDPDLTIPFPPLPFAA
jgi:hypothetical protein